MVMVFVALAGLKLVEAPTVRVPSYRVLISLKTADALAVLAEIAAVDGYHNIFCYDRQHRSASHLGKMSCLC